jgi:hypothetical protein
MNPNSVREAPNMPGRAGRSHAQDNGATASQTSPGTLPWFLKIILEDAPS